MIISGFFTNLYGTEFGGRPNAYKKRYLFGLASLASNSQKKIIYTSPNDRDELTDFLKKTLSIPEFKRYVIKPFYLTNQTFHPSIIILKKEFGYLSDRCLQIQYGKFQWIMECIKEEEDNYTWWVDAGLISNHLFPNIYVENIESSKNISSDNFFNQLVTKADGKTYFICGDRSNGYAHSLPNQKYFDKGYQTKLHPIGGFFGGNSLFLNNFLLKCNLKIGQTLHDKVLYSEEVIMEIILSETIENCSFDIFTTWRHEESSEFKRLNSLDCCKSFYKNFIAY
jgi:hypothetical protein